MQPEIVPTVPPSGHSGDHETQANLAQTWWENKTNLKQLLMYAFYFSKTIYNTSKIKNVANKKVFSTSLNSWGAVTSSRTTHWLIPSHQSTHQDTSLGHSSDSCVSKVTITLSNDGCIYECVLLVAACNVILCSAFNTYSMFFVGL